MRSGSKIVSPPSVEEVTCHAAHADHNPSMLNSSIGIIKLGTYGSGVRSHGMGDKFGQPVVVGHLNVIVDENEDVKN